MRNWTTRQKVWAGVIAAVIVALAIAPWFVVPNMLAKEWDEETNRAKAAGLCVTAEDMKRFEVADKDNAAILYDQLIPFLKKHSAAISAGTAKTAQDADRTRLGALAQEVMPLIEKASGKPGYYRKRDCSRDALTSDHVRYVARIVRILSALSEVEAKEKRWETAIGYLRTAKRIVEQLRTEVTFTAFASQPSRNRTLAVALSFVQKNPDDVHLAGLVSAFLDEEWPVPDPKVNWQGEYVFMRTLFLNIETGKPSLGKNAAPPILRIPFRVAALKTLSRMRVCYESLPEFGKDWPAVEKAFAEFQKSVEADSSPLGQLANAFTLQTTGLGSAYIRGIAKLRLTRVAARLVQIRQKTGKFPESLPEMGEDTRDPFGEALRYRKTATGFLLYSMGQDRKDDQGDTQKDLAIRLTCPPRP